MLSLRPRSVHSESIPQQASRLTREALSRWACAHPESEWEASRALRLFGANSVADYSDELGDETFLVRDSVAPDGAFVAGRNWCACDPAHESPICCHSLAVCLLLGYRSHFARLSAKQPLRVFAVIVKKEHTVTYAHERLGEHLADVIQQNRAVVGGAK